MTPSLVDASDTDKRGLVDRDEAAAKIVASPEGEERMDGSALVAGSDKLGGASCDQAADKIDAPPEGGNIGSALEGASDNYDKCQGADRDQASAEVEAPLERRKDGLASVDVSDKCEGASCDEAAAKIDAPLKETKVGSLVNASDKCEGASCDQFAVKVDAPLEGEERKVDSALVDASDKCDDVTCDEGLAKIDAPLEGRQLGSVLDDASGKCEGARICNKAAAELDAPLEGRTDDESSAKIDAPLEGEGRNDKCDGVSCDQATAKIDPLEGRKDGLASVKASDKFERADQDEASAEIDAPLEGEKGSALMDTFDKGGGADREEATSNIDAPLEGRKEELALLDVSDKCDSGSGDEAAVKIGASLEENGSTPVDASERKHLPDGTPLKNIDDYDKGDVLCGRGGAVNKHEGNRHWRSLVAAHKRLYRSLPKMQKVLVAESIVKLVRSQTPGGRFLAIDSVSNKWNDIGDDKATKKTSQALREGASDICTQMEQKQNSESTNLRKGVAGYPMPGHMLPNGLIALDYEAVAVAQEKVLHRGPQANMDPTMMPELQLFRAGLSRHGPLDEDDANVAAPQPDVRGASTDPLRAPDIRPVDTQQPVAADPAASREERTLADAAKEHDQDGSAIAATVRPAEPEGCSAGVDDTRVDDTATLHLPPKEAEEEITVPSGGLGIQFEMVEGVMSGAKIVHVAPSSSLCGKVSNGDLIVAVDGKLVRVAEDLMAERDRPRRFRILRRGTDARDATADSSNDAKDSLPIQAEDEIVVPSGALGIQFEMVEGATMGAQITQVAPSSSLCEKVSKGDLIVAVDGKPVRVAEDLMAERDRPRRFGILRERTVARDATADSSNGAKDPLPTEKEDEIVVPSGALGIQFEMVEGAKRGAQIFHVTQSSSLRGKVSKGDFIVAVDGKPVRAAEDLMAERDRSRRFRILRGGASAAVANRSNDAKDGRKENKATAAMVDPQTSDQKLTKQQCTEMRRFPLSSEQQLLQQSSATLQPPRNNSIGNHLNYKYPDVAQQQGGASSAEVGQLWQQQYALLQKYYQMLQQQYIAEQQQQNHNSHNCANLEMMQQQAQIQKILQKHHLFASLQQHLQELFAAFQQKQTNNIANGLNQNSANLEMTQEQAQIQTSQQECNTLPNTLSNKRKRGLSIEAEERGYLNNMLKMAALGLFMDSECRPLQTYCQDHDVPFLCHGLWNLIASESRLKFILQGRQRQKQQLVVEATAIIRQRFKNIETEMMLKKAALALFNDSQCRYLDRYCQDQDASSQVREGLRALIMSESRLQFIMQGDRRLEPRLVAEATAIIRERFPLEDDRISNQAVARATTKRQAEQREGVLV